MVHSSDLNGAGGDAMPAIYRMTSRVRPYECDSDGHLNTVNYIRFMQEGMIEHFVSKS